MNGARYKLLKLQKIRIKKRFKNKESFFMASFYISSQYFLNFPKKNILEIANSHEIELYPFVMCQQRWSIFNLND